MSDRPKADSPTVEVGTLSKLFNLTAVRIQQLASDGIIIKHARGKYDLWASIRNYIKYLQERKVNQWSAEGEEDGYAQHRSRLTKAKADMAELDAELKKGTVHAAPEVAAVMSDIIANTRARFLGFPTKLAGALDGLDTVDREAVIREHVNELLTELRDYKPSMFNNATKADADEDEEDEDEDESADA